MGNHRNTLVAAVRQELATARGTARAVLAAAESARGEAHQRRRLVRHAYATCVAQLAEARDTARIDILRRFHASVAALSGDIDAVAAVCARGAAGASWPTWAPTEPDRDRGPGLLRIGTIAYDPPAPPGRAAIGRRPALPALVPLLDHAHLELVGEAGTVDGIVSGLLLRVLGSTAPSHVQLTVYDPRRGRLAGFAPLGSAGLASFVGPGGLPALLDEVDAQVRRIEERLLGGGHTGLAQFTATAGRRPEPWRVIVLLAGPGDAVALTTAQRARLDRITRAGVACGVHLLVCGLPLIAHRHVHRIVVNGAHATCDVIGDLPIRLDFAPPADRVAALSRSVADRALAGPGPGTLADLMPDRLWRHSSADGLSAPIGAGPDGELVHVPLGDDPPHALIGGPPGSGKTNLIHAWLGSLTTRYGPEELALYLLDFSGDVAFARFAPRPGDPSWLPQVRLAGVNVTGDREFGVALLRHLGEELRARAQAAKRHEAGTLAELRAEDPDGHWPRIVAVVDEFQVLLDADDTLADEAANLLEDLARRGRSQGIHLVLAAPDVTALADRPGLLGQLALRIALPGAHRVLAEGNLAAALIPRHHAVVNSASGVAGANRVVRLPDAGAEPTWRSVQHRLWRSRPAGWAPPQLFDGAAVPRLAAAHRPAGRLADARTDPGSSPGAVLGEHVDVGARPARLRLGRMPGRNLAVLGTRTIDACDVLAAAALSLAAQGPARFSIACLDAGAQPAAVRLAAELPRCSYHDTAAVGALLTALTDELDDPGDIPHYLVGYALDALPDERHGPLRALLERGPEQRSHVLGWWRSVSRLRDGLGGADARLDTIGAWVALDTPGAQLSALSPQPSGPSWTPRARRALFFDRSVHRCPDVIIPYEVNSDHS